MSRIHQPPGLNLELRLAQLERAVARLQRQMPAQIVVADSANRRRVVINQDGSISILDETGKLRVLVGNQGDGTYDVKTY